MGVALGEDPTCRPVTDEQLPPFASFVVSGEQVAPDCGEDGVVDGGYCGYCGDGGAAIRFRSH